MEKDIQLFVSANADGGILNAQMGKDIVMVDPGFPFVFMIDEKTAGHIARNLSDFSIEIVNFEPKLMMTEEVNNDLS